MGATVQRTQVPVLDDVETREDTLRVYYDAMNDVGPCTSVTTIKDLRVDPQKDESLQGWRERFDGKSKYARPWWNDQMAFKGHRGTLIHFSILSELGDATGETYFHDVGGRDWGYEEYYSEYCLKKWSRKAPSANTDVVPTPQNNEYDGEHAWDRAVRGMKWAAKSFKEQFIDRGHIDPSQIHTVEEYVFDEEYGYGGQFDLLYEAPDGATVLADLKTSSGIRFGNKLQLAAYKHAIESRGQYSIDRCEIHRLHPDSESTEISCSTEWDRTLDGLEHQFLGLCDLAKVTYQQTLQNAKEELLE